MLLDEIWADEGGIRIRILQDPNNSRIIQFVDVSEGWGGTVLAEATVADFRRNRVIEAFQTTHERSASESE